MSQTVGTIKESVAAFLQVSEASLIKGSVDLVLTALNNARKHAERLHDWDCEKTEAYGTVSGGVGDVDSWVKLEDDSALNIKQVETYYLQSTTGGKPIPLFAHTKKHEATWSRELDPWAYRDSSSRYRSDIVPSLYGYDSYRPGQKGPYEVFVRNKKFTLQPRPTEDVVVQGDVYVWLDDYTDDDDTDFFTEHGADYLMYAAIVECNLLTQTFVPQQEGSLSPPQKAADNAFGSLVVYDKWIVANGRAPQ